MSNVGFVYCATDNDIIVLPEDVYKYNGNTRGCKIGMTKKGTIKSRMKQNSSWRSPMICIRAYAVHKTMAKDIEDAVHDEFDNYNLRLSTCKESFSILVIDMLDDFLHTNFNGMYYKLSDEDLKIINSNRKYKYSGANFVYGDIDTDHSSDDDFIDDSDSSDSDRSAKRARSDDDSDSYDSDRSAKRARSDDDSDSSDSDHSAKRARSDDDDSDYVDEDEEC